MIALQNWKTGFQLNRWVRSDWIRFCGRHSNPPFKQNLQSLTLLSVFELTSLVWSSFASKRLHWLCWVLSVCRTTRPMWISLLGVSCNLWFVRTVSWQCLRWFETIKTNGSIFDDRWSESTVPRSQPARAVWRLGVRLEVQDRYGNTFQLLAFQVVNRDCCLWF